MRINDFGDWEFDEINDDDLQSEDDSDDPDQLEFDDEWDDYDDNPDDDEYGDDDSEPLDELDSSMDQGDDYEPSWWEDGMPDDWWDYYGDDYEVDEFEIAIDY